MELFDGFRLKPTKRMRKPREAQNCPNGASFGKSQDQHPVSPLPPWSNNPEFVVHEERKCRRVQVVEFRGLIGDMHPTSATE